MSTVEAFKQTGKTWWRYTKIGALILILLTILFFAFMIFANYSEGSRTGYVTKISHKGYVFKTWEGELNFGFFGGAPTGGKPSDNIWSFSVTNTKVARQVEEASKTGHKVTLHYKQKYIKINLRGETEYLVYKVEDLHEQSPKQPETLPQLQ